MVRRKDKRTGKKDHKSKSLRNAVKHPGSLKKEGFNENESLKKEEQAIKKADKRYGRKETDRKLGFLEGMTKRYPEIHKKIKSLIRWNR